MLAIITMRQTQRSAASNHRTKKKSSLAIVGAGRLGTALGIALRRVGYPIDLVVAKHTTTARRSARLIGGAPTTLSINQFASRSIAAENSIFIIATPDDAIAKVAEVLASNIPSRFDGRRKSISSPRVAMHTSGALSSRVLQPLRDRGFATASFHPLISISTALTGAEWLGRAFFGVEGDAHAVRTAKELVRELGGKSFTINPDRKALYHAAALMASPNTTALFDIILEILNRCGLPNAQARQVLLPLVQSTLENLSAQDPSAALTGTFKRGDLATVRKHIAALQAESLEDALEAYLLLGRRSLAMGKPKNRKQIESLLTRT